MSIKTQFTNKNLLINLYFFKFTLSQKGQPISGQDKLKDKHVHHPKFDFYELGQPLFLENGNLNEAVGVEKLRQYVYYTETKMPLAPTISSPSGRSGGASYLGTHNDTAYYFNYDADATTNLNYDFLSTLHAKAEQYVIYADNCLLTKEFMAKHHIIFKKIPRDITQF